MVWAAVAQAAGQVAGKAIDSNVERERAAFDAVFEGGGSGVSTRATEAVFDNSGWNVSFGSSRLSSQAEKTTDMAGPTTSQGGLPGLLGGAVDATTLALVAGGIVLLVVVMKKRKAA